MKLTIVLLFLAGFSAFSEEPDFNFTSRDWRVAGEKEDPFLGVPSCRMVSTRSSPGNDVQISFSFPKDYVKAPLAVISMSERRHGLKVQLIFGGRAQTALPLYEEDVNKNFWYLPTDVDRLLSQMAAANLLNLRVVSAEGEENVQVSLMGVSRSLQETQRCLGLDNLYKRAFFSELNNSEVTALEVNGSLSSVRLFDLFQMSYMFFHTIESIENELNDLRIKDQGILNDERAALEVFDRADGTFGSARTRLAEGEKRILFLEAEKEKAGKDIERLKLTLPLAEEEYSKLRTRYEPVRTRLTLLQGEVSRLKNEFGVLTDKISLNKEEIAKDQKALEILNRDASAVLNRLGEVQNENEKFSLKKKDSDAGLSSFHVEDQVYGRVNSHARVTSARQEVGGLRDQLPPLEAAVRKAQEEQLSAQKGFESCRRNGGQNGSSCAEEMAVLQRAQAEFSRRQSDLRRVNTSIARLESEISQIRQKIRDQVMKEWTVLDTENKVLAEYLGKIAHRMRLLKNRLNDLREIQLPSLNDRISEAQKNEKLFESESFSVGSSLAQAEVTLKDFVLSSDQENLFEKLNEADRERQRQAALKTSLEKSIQDGEAEKAVLSRENEELRLVIPQYEKELELAAEVLRPIQEKTKDYHEKSSVLSRRVEDLKSQYQLTLGHYKYVFDHLVGNKEMF